MKPDTDSMGRSANLAIGYQRNISTYVNWWLVDGSQ